MAEEENPELGALVDPRTQQQGSWDQLLKDPVTRAGLLSAGLQMMTGGWGNTTQQLAAGIGAGAAGAAGTAEHIQKQGINSRDFAAREDEGNKNRASHERIADSNRTSRQEIAGMQASNKLEVQTLKSEAMLERARLIHGPQSNQEMKIYSDAFNKYHHDQVSNQLLTRKPDAQIKLEAEAHAKTVLQGAREASGVRSQGAPLPSDGTSTETTGRPGQASPAPGQKPATAPAKSGEAKTGPRELSWSELQKIPGFEEAMSDPAKRARVRQDNPNLAPYIDEYGKDGYNAPHNLLRRSLGLPPVSTGPSAESLDRTAAAEEGRRHIR